MIRSVDDGAFGVCSAPNCRHHYASMAVMQLKDVPWSYLFQCMKISAKHFDSVILPPKLAPDFVKHIRADFTFCVCAWYDTEHDGIHVLAYNGHYHEEENTSPAYDGYGRYDTSYGIVEGVINADGTAWICPPSCRFVGLYG